MDPDQIRLIYTLGGKQKDVLTKVLLPGSVPLIISNMKVNIGLCLVGVIIGEFSPPGRPWLLISLRQPGLQAGSRDHVHRDPLYSVRNPVSGGGSAGTEV